MALRLPDHWVWDTWYAVDGDDVHAFFLHAPRSLGDPDRRHAAARIGHAVSQDLVRWEVRPFALEPGPPGAWDGLATWTGSVIRDVDGWLMAYSGVAVATGLGMQRIGFARSGDLETWRRWGPVLAADPRWYECGDDVVETHWRDPWAWRDDAGRLHVYVTARAAQGPEDGRGVIGHAWCREDGSWEVGPPVSVPGELRQLEVPQLLETASGHWAVLACCRWSDHAAVRRARPGNVAETGTVALDGASPLGPFVVPPGRFLDGSPDDRRYAGRIVEHRGRRWFMAWIDRREDGTFAGELGDPVPVQVDATGRLRLSREAPAH
jgi:beta-fructofuranosidase